MVTERDVCALKDIDGWRDKETPIKKSNDINYLLVGLLCAYFWRVLKITFFKFNETDGF